MFKQSYGLLLSIIVHIAIFLIPFSFTVTQIVDKKDEELKLLAIVQTVPEKPQGKKENNDCPCENCNCEKQDVNLKQPESQKKAVLKKPAEKPVQPQVKKKKTESRKKTEPKKKKTQKPRKRIQVVKKKTLPKKEPPQPKKEPEPARTWKQEETKWDNSLPYKNGTTENKSSSTSTTHNGTPDTQKPQGKYQTSGGQGAKGKSSNKAKVSAKKFTSVERKFGLHEGPGFLHQSVPKYPRQAKRRGKEGVVILKLTIDEKGRLINVKVIKDPGYGLAQAAVAAVKKSTFYPAKDRGKPVVCRCLLPVKFVLR